jgi:hypothetical protein
MLIILAHPTDMAYAWNLSPGDVDLENISFDRVMELAKRARLRGALK